MLRQNDRQPRPARLPAVLLAAAVCTAGPLALGQDSAASSPPSQPPAAASRERPRLQLTARDPLVIDDASGEVVARGDARVTLGEVLLTADEIRYERASETVTASGQVTVTGGGLRLVAGTARYRIADGSLELDGFRVGRPPFLASGVSASGTLRDLEVRGGVAWIGEPGGVTPSLATERLTLRDERFGLAGTRARLGTTPLLPLPNLSRPIADPGIRGRVRGGHTDALGAYLRPEITFPISDRLAFQGGIEIFYRRGLLVAPGFRYGTATTESAPPLLAQGDVETSFIRDNGPVGTDPYGRAIDRDRFLLAWRHRQALGASTDIAAAFEYWSDVEFTRDFRSERFDLREQPDSTVEIVHQSGPFVVTLLGRLPADDFQPVIARLPELRADLMPAPVGSTGILQQGFLSTAFLLQDPQSPTGPGDTSLTLPAPGRRSILRAEAGWEFSRPTTLATGVTFTPVAAARAKAEHLVDGDAFGGDRDRSVVLGEVGFDLNAAFHRDWEASYPVWGINGLRHVVVPFVEHRWRGSSRSGDRLPFLAETVFITAQPPLDLLDPRALELLEAVHVLRYGLDQRLLTRADGFGSRSLARLRLGQDLYLADAPRSAIAFTGHTQVDRRHSDLFADLSLTPASWFDLGIFARIATSGQAVAEFNPRLTLRDGRRWRLDLARHYLDGGYDQYVGEAGYTINEAWRLAGRVRYDADRDRFDEQTYSLLQNVADTWEIEYRVSFFEGDRREGGFGLGIAVQFLRF